MTADNARSGVLIARLGRRVQILALGTVRALPELFGFTWIDWNFFFFFPVLEYTTGDRILGGPGE